MKTRPSTFITFAATLTLAATNIAQASSHGPNETSKFRVSGLTVSAPVSLKATDKKATLVTLTQSGNLLKAGESEGALKANDQLDSRQIEKVKFNADDGAPTSYMVLQTEGKQGISGFFGGGLEVRFNLPVKVTKEDNQNVDVPVLATPTLSVPASVSGQNVGLEMSYARGETTQFDYNQIDSCIGTKYIMVRVEDQQGDQQKDNNGNASHGNGSGNGSRGNGNGRPQPGDNGGNSGRNEPTFHMERTAVSYTGSQLKKYYGNDREDGWQVSLVSSAGSVAATFSFSTFAQNEYTRDLSPCVEDRGSDWDDRGRDSNRERHMRIHDGWIGQKHK